MRASPATPIRRFETYHTLKLTPRMAQPRFIVMMTRGELALWMNVQHASILPNPQDDFKGLRERSQEISTFYAVMKCFVQELGFQIDGPWVMRVILK